MWSGRLGQVQLTNHCYGAETLRGYSLRCIENRRLLIVFCLGPFWYTQQLYFDSRFIL
jgi:hypothetical protein